MDAAQTKEKIREFFSRFVRARELRDDEDIFATGYVNSMLAMQLVAFIESEFGITVEDEDLDLDNFKSLDNIAGFIERKKTVTHAGA
jgi:acyl carrier protein